MLDIEALAKEAGFVAYAGRVLVDPPGYQEPCECTVELRRFAELVEAVTREDDALTCEARYMGDNNREDMEAKRCAAAIRALKSA